MKRSVFKRACWHVQNGLEHFQAMVRAYDARYGAGAYADDHDYKDAASDKAAFVLKSAKADPKALGLLEGAGIDPETPRRTLAAIKRFL